MIHPRYMSLFGLALAACSPASSAPEVQQALMLVLPPEVGSLHLVNNGARPVRIEREIRVEYKGAGGWTAVWTEFNAVAACPRPTPTGTGPVTIAAGTTLAVQRWRGFTCSGQCQEACRANVYSGARQLTSATFAMPTHAVQASYERRLPDLR